MAGTLGHRIRKARKDAGYSSPEQFSVKLGISSATLQRYETGRTVPTVSRLLQIALLTRQPVGFFLNGDQEAA